MTLLNQLNDGEKRDIIDRIFDNASGSYQGRNERLGLHWKIGPRSSVVLVVNNPLLSISIIFAIVRSWLILMYQYRQFKAPFPEIFSWAYNLQGFLYDVTLPISVFLKKIFKIKSPSKEIFEDVDNDLKHYKYLDPNKFDFPLETPEEDKEDVNPKQGMDILE